jgi:hypothetical protein
MTLDCRVSCVCVCVCVCVRAWGGPSTYVLYLSVWPRDLKFQKVWYMSWDSSSVHCFLEESLLTVLNHPPPPPFSLSLSVFINPLLAVYTVVERHSGSLSRNWKERFSEGAKMNASPWYLLQVLDSWVILYILQFSCFVKQLTVYFFFYFSAEKLQLPYKYERR